MLKAEEFTCPENVSPFPGAIVDSCFEQSNKAPVKILFTQYVRLTINLSDDPGERPRRVFVLS